MLEQRCECGTVCDFHTIFKNILNSNICGKSKNQLSQLLILFSISQFIFLAWLICKLSTYCVIKEALVGETKVYKLNLFFAVLKSPFWLLIFNIQYLFTTFLSCRAKKYHAFPSPAFLLIYSCHNIRCFNH